MKSLSAEAREALSRLPADAWVEAYAEQLLVELEASEERRAWVHERLDRVVKALGIGSAALQALRQCLAAFSVRTGWSYRRRHTTTQARWIAAQELADRLFLLGPEYLQRMALALDLPAEQAAAPAGEADARRRADAALDELRTALAKGQPSDPPVN